MKKGKRMSMALRESYSSLNSPKSKQTSNIINQNREKKKIQYQNRKIANSLLSVKSEYNF